MPDTLVVLLIVLVVAVIWRGPRTIPEIGRMLGRGVRGARDEARSLRHDDERPPDQPGA